MANSKRPELRARALQELGQAYGRVLDESGAIAIVAGESGVGKSWLVSKFLGGSSTSGATVLSGGCIDVEGGAPPYWPVADAFRSLARDCTPADLESALGGLWPELVTLLPGLVEDDRSGGDGYGSASQYRLFEVVLGAIERLSARSPVVVLIEDLHWADLSTRDLLSFLAANLSRIPVLLVATYRTDELVPGHPLHVLLGGLFRLPGARLVELERMDRPELDRMLHDSLGMRPNLQVADEIWTRSDGNPFFALELLDSVLAGQTELPTTLRQILQARLAQLDPAAQQALRMAHVAGGVVRHELLAAMGGIGELELMGALRNCVAAKMLVVDSESGCYRFRHSLLREAVHEDVLPGERTALHEACAGALELRPALAHGSAAGEIARHWRAAGRDARALPASLAAATTSERAFGYAEALEHYEHALRLSGALGLPDDELLDLLERAAECANLAGDHGRAGALAQQAADKTSDARRAALIWERRARYLWDAGASEDALAACEAALRLFPREPESASFAQIVGTYAEALMMAGRFDGAREQAELALAVARRTGGRREEAAALSTLGFVSAYLGDGDPVELLHEARDIAEQDGHPDDVARVYVHLVSMLSGPLNRLEEAIEVARTGLKRVTELGFERTHGVMLRASVINTLFRMGRWSEADRWAADAFASRPQGAPAIDLYLARAKILISRGRLTDARDDLARARALSTRAVDPRYRAPLATLEAGLALWEGDLSRARQAAAAGLANLTASEEVWYTAPLVWHGLRVEAEAAARPAPGRNSPDAYAKAALELHCRLEALTSRVPDAARPIHLSLEAYRAMCRSELSRARRRSDPDLWEQAVAAWDRMKHPYPAAYCRFRLAEALLANRRRSQTVAALLTDARRTAESLGAEPFRREVDALVRASGLSLEWGGEDAKPDGIVAPAVAELGLTPREIEVLRLLAEGSSNREVAETLFISEKTAGVHVSHILAKLGLRNRSQAGALAHRLELAGGRRGPVGAVTENKAPGPGD